MDSEQQCLNR